MPVILSVVQHSCLANRQMLLAGNSALAPAFGPGADEAGKIKGAVPGGAHCQKAGKTSRHWAVGNIGRKTGESLAWVDG